MNIIGVAGRGELDAMNEFIAETGVSTFEHIADVDGSVWGRYSVTSQPAFVFINDDGTSETLISALGEERLTAKIEGLIAN